MKKMGMRGSPTGEIFLDDVRVPADQLLGGGVRERGHVKSSLASERVGLAGDVVRHRRALLRDRPRLRARAQAIRPARSPSIR